jgi:hypothetical protein
MSHALRHWCTTRDGFSEDEADRSASFRATSVPAYRARPLLGARWMPSATARGNSDCRSGISPKARLRIANGIDTVAYAHKPKPTRCQG